MVPRLLLSVRCTKPEDLVSQYGRPQEALADLNSLSRPHTCHQHVHLRTSRILIPHFAAPYIPAIIPSERLPSFVHCCQQRLSIFTFLSSFVCCYDQFDLEDLYLSVYVLHTSSTRCVFICVSINTRDGLIYPRRVEASLFILTVMH